MIKYMTHFAIFVTNRIDGQTLFDRIPDRIPTPTSLDKFPPYKITEILSYMLLALIVHCAEMISTEHGKSRLSFLLKSN